MTQATLAFLFTDIEGSTEHWESESDLMAAAVARHDSLVTRSVEARAGTVVKSTGDGIFATFPRVDDAVAAAVRAQRMLADEPWETSTPILVRMGIHAGVAQSRDADWFGRDVGVAARVCDAGHGGQILLSDTAASMLDPAGGTDLEALGLHRLRGVLRPMTIHSVRGTGDRPLRAEPMVLSNLPAEVDAMVGRDTELGVTADLLTRHRIVTVTGPGGSGKTRLAIRAARTAAESHSDGVWFVDLAGTADPSEVASAVAQAIGVDPAPGQAVEPQLVTHLRSRRCLVVLDGCEHVVDAVADLVEDLARGSTGVTFLVTSRVLLDIAGEAVLRLGDLGLPETDTGATSAARGSDACRLFVERARQVAPDLELGPSCSDAIVAICRAVDGLPLGIELAAAQLRVLGVEELAVSIGSADDLEPGRRRGRSRRSSLRAVVESSHTLLEVDDRRAFEDLAVMAGPFSVEAAAAVLGVPTTEARRTMATLVDHSMVVRSGDGRLRLLSVLRRFALERLEERGGVDGARDRHLRWALGLVAELEAAMRTPGQDDALRRVRGSHDDLRSARGRAIEVGGVLDALRITVSAPVDPAGERDRTILELMGRLGDVPDDLAARALYTCAAASLERGEWREVERRAADASTLFHRSGDLVQQAYADLASGFGRWGDRNDPDLGSHLSALASRFDDLADRMGRSYVQWVFGQWLLEHSPDHDRLRSLAEDAVEGFREVGSGFGLAHAREGLSCVRLHDGDRHAAARLALDALEELAGDSNIRCASHALDVVAWVGVHSGEASRAAALFGASKGMRDEVGACLRPWEQARHARCEHLLIAELGREALADARSTSEGLGLDAAVERAATLVERIDPRP